LPGTRSVALLEQNVLDDGLPVIPPADPVGLPLLAMTPRSAPPSPVPGGESGMSSDRTLDERAVSTS
jgi:hypothetical protein